MSNLNPGESITLHDFESFFEIFRETVANSSQLEMAKRRCRRLGSLHKSGRERWRSVKDSQPFPKCAPVHDEKSGTDRVFEDLLRGGIPIQSLSGPIGLGGHDAHDRMREAVI